MSDTHPSLPPTAQATMFSSALVSTSTLYSYAITYIRSWMIQALETGIQTGSLRLSDHHGFEYHFGDTSTKKHAADLHILNDDFWLRLFLSYDLGFSEAYMHGDFETTDLKAILDLWLLNRSSLSGLWSPISRLGAAISAFTLRMVGQNKLNAQLNVVTGYDYDNELFKAFLSKDMMYSCALWNDDMGGVHGDLTCGPYDGDLEAAQLNKVHHVLKKARVRPGDRLLEFGTGWGTLSIEAAKLGCTVDTLTLSVEQKREAEQRIRNLGLESRIRVHLMDYRELPPHFENAFDAFVAIEMVEHVGLNYHAQLFKILNWALKKDRAAAVMTATSTPDWRYTTFQVTDYARKYQWPNAFCPSPTRFPQACMDAVPGGFALETVEDTTHHYPRTLREWGRRFQKNWEELSSDLLKAHPELSEGDNLNILKRKWEYMYVYAEIGFARAYTTCTNWVFVRPENSVTYCG